MLSTSSKYLGAAIALATLLSPFPVLSGLVCPDDPSNSGCVMCKGSDLLNGWNSGLNHNKACESISSNDVQAKIDCFCKGYAIIAKAWSQGRCCTEYAPTLAASGNVCNLATHPVSYIKQHMDDIIGDAKRVENTIWHNDIGTNVPKVFKYIPPYNAKSVSGEGSEPQTHKFSTHPSSKTYHQSSRAAQSVSYRKQWKGGADEKNAGTWQHSTKKDYHHAHFDSPGWKHPYGRHSYGHTSRHSSRVHHKARGCSSDEEKYHEFAQSHSKRSNIEPEQIGEPETKSVSQSPKLEKRHKDNCGIDFHNVPYPSTVPPTVLKVFSEL